MSSQTLESLFIGDTAGAAESSMPSDDAPRRSLQRHARAGVKTSWRTEAAAARRRRGRELTPPHDKLISQDMKSFTAAACRTRCLCMSDPTITTSDVLGLAGTVSAVLEVGMQSQECSATIMATYGGGSRGWSLAWPSFCRHPCLRARLRFPHTKASNTLAFHSSFAACRRQIQHTALLVSGCRPSH